MMHFVYSLLPDLGAQIEQEKQEGTSKNFSFLRFSLDLICDVLI